MSSITIEDKVWNFCDKKGIHYTITRGWVWSVWRNITHLPVAKLQWIFIGKPIAVNWYNTLHNWEKNEYFCVYLSSLLSRRRYTNNMHTVILDISEHSIRILKRNFCLTRLSKNKVENFDIYFNNFSQLYKRSRRINHTLRALHYFSFFFLFAKVPRRSSKTSTIVNWIKTGQPPKGKTLKLFIT